MCGVDLRLKMQPKSLCGVCVGVLHEGVEGGEEKAWDVAMLGSPAVGDGSICPGGCGREEANLLNTMRL